MISQWWTGGERDDIFWRTVGSGGWKSNRSRRGSDTTTQEGDIQAIDPDGKALIDHVTIENKVGYGKWSFLDMIDKGDRNVDQTSEEFLSQCIEQAPEGKWPVLLTKRPQRKIMISFVRPMFEAIRKIYPITDAIRDTHMIVRFRHEKGLYEFVVIRLTDFFEWCPPEFFREKQWIETPKQKNEGYMRFVNESWEKRHPPKRRKIRVNR